ncbi:unnamed protein product [Ambrosiozyma monospora]|uniref:Unnamed protein product n=1 Tax=Ambrosiozyma monospora TaxID=43982 RepID=A0ACB5SSG5_AMBMO|nr:unnamed protein product [Ambrosiozyma monospora]
MQFSTALIFASSALAYSSVFETKTNQETDLVTVTSCASTVTNCPAAHAKNGTNSITTYEAGAPTFGSYYAAGVAAFAAGALLFLHKVNRYEPQVLQNVAHLIALRTDGGFKLKIDSGTDSNYLPLKYIDELVQKCSTGQLDLGIPLVELNPESMKIFSNSLSENFFSDRLKLRISLDDLNPERLINIVNSSAKKGLEFEYTVSSDSNKKFCPRFTISNPTLEYFSLNSNSYLIHKGII